MLTADRAQAQIFLGVSSSSAKPTTSPARQWTIPSGGWAAVLESVADEVFGTMLGVAAVRGSDAPPPGGNITAMVGLAGGLSGVLSVRCRLEVAGQLASSMLGMDTTEAEAPTRDALGELANVIAGCIKCRIPGLEDACFLSTPTVVIGHNFRVYSRGDCVTTEVPFHLGEWLVWLVLDIN